MPKKLLIIVTGLPGTGKTTLAKKIAAKFKLPLISKDTIKEILFDELGAQDRTWSKKVGKASYTLLYHFASLMLQNGQSLILESNFCATCDSPKFQKIESRYRCQVLQIICFARGEVLIERFKKRSQNKARHPGHVDSKNLAEFQPRLLKEKIGPLKVKGPIIEIEMTDFKKIDYRNFFKKIEKYAKFKT